MAAFRTNKKVMSVGAVCPLSVSATTEGSPGTGSQRRVAPSWAGPLSCKTNTEPDATLFKAYVVLVLSS